MIVVRIELHSAITNRVTELGRMEITNNGTGTEDKGDYTVRVLPMGRRPTDNRRLRVATVRGYPRLTENIWQLVMQALNAAFEKRVKAPSRLRKAMTTLGLAK